MLKNFYSQIFLSLELFFMKYTFSYFNYINNTNNFYIYYYYIILLYLI